MMITIIIISRRSSSSSSISDIIIIMYDFIWGLVLNVAIFSPFGTIILYLFI